MSLDQRANRPGPGSRGVSGLIDVMREQERLGERLLELSFRERAAVAEGRLEDLEHSARDKGSLVEQMDLLEMRRRGLAEQLALELGLPASTPLTRLASCMTEPEAGNLLELRRSVTEVVDRLRESNESNLLLMRKSLELVRGSIQNLRRATGSGETYASNGRPAGMLRDGIAVDCHA